MKKISTLFAALFAVTSLYAAGDIYEIRPCVDGLGYSSLTSAGKNKPIATRDEPIIAAGKDLYFNVRLAARKVGDHGDAGATFSIVNKDGLPFSEEYFKADPIKLGIYVGGRPDTAEMISLPKRTPLKYDGSENTSDYLWDVIFHYRVKAADLGLPIKLAVTSDDDPLHGIPYPENYDAEGSLKPAGADYQVYYGSWKIQYTPTSGEVSKAQMLTWDDSDQYNVGSKPENDILRNRSLADCGFWAKTLDFKNGSDELVVKNGHTLGGSIVLEEGAEASSASELYVWAVDKDWYDTIVANPLEAQWKEPSVRLEDAEEKTLVVGHDASGEIKRSVWVKKVTIVAGRSQGDFTIRGKSYVEGAENRSVLILSSAAAFTWKNTTGSLVQNFLTTTARCEKSEPELTLRRSETKLVYNVTSNYSERVTTLNLTLSDPYTEKMTVTLTPKIVKQELKDVYKWEDLVRIAKEEVETGVVPAEGAVTVEIDAGKTVEDMPIYLYGMGASADENLWSAKKGNLIDFDVAVEPEGARDFLKLVAHDSLYLVPDAPVIANADAVKAITVASGEPEPVSFVLHDNYTDITDTTTGYAIKAMWWDDDEGAPSDYKFGQNCFDLATVDGKIKAFTPDAKGILTALKDGAMVANTLPAIPADVRGQNLRLRFDAPNKARTAYLDIRVTVVTKPKARGYAYATKSGTEKPDSFDEITAAGDATSAFIGINLESPNKSGGVLYAFLEFKDQTQTNLISGRCLIKDGAAQKGVRIPAGESKEASRLEVKLLDGIEDDTLLQFKVVLCTDEPYSADKVYQKYDTSSPVEIVVVNVKPTVRNISMSGWNLDESGKTFEGDATKDIDQIFTFDIRDAKLDLEAEDADAFKLTYQFKNCSPTYTKSVTHSGDPSKLVVTNKFTETGVATLNVTLTDKDGGVTGPLAYTFNVVDKPAITISNKAAIDTFFEDETPEYSVKLSNNPASVDLTVELTVAAQAKDDKAGELTVGGDFEPKEGATDVYTCTYKPGDTLHTFYVSSADGTAAGASKFSFTAKVTTSDKYVPETTTPWSDYFSAGRLSPITVKNAKPTLTIDGRLCRAARDESGESDDIIYLNSSNSPIQVAIGEAPVVTWSANDVKKDLDGTIKVTIVDQYGSHKYEATSTADKTFPPSFKYAGPTTVHFTATDKDGDSIEAERFYTVKATRQLNLTAVGPSDNGNSSPHASYYRGAGRGQGHVYAAATCTGAHNYSFDFNCGLAANVKATGQGYRVGEYDDGSLTKNGSLGDNAILPGGTLAPAGTPRENCFLYEGDRDSFFYVWVRDVQGDDGKFTSEIYGDVSPEVTQAVSATFTLPTEVDKETGGYPISLYEAIFSKELFKTDNIGDINADGVPDIYALGYTGFGVSGADMTDMTDLSQFNDDGDYLPFALDQTSFVFLPSNSWARDTLKFTARLEIRGYGDHLNDAWKVLSDASKAGSIPEYSAEKDPKTTFTALEYDAWLQAGSDPNWSPERPSDPTKADTDADGMPDGYEYYIWYKAHVGWMDGNVHKYLTGRKYNPANPYDPIPLTSETIAGLYDPLVPNHDFGTLDTDDDGLTDYAEFILGTNPFDFDTDGDGLPDGYEVAFTGTSPLKSATDDQHPDGTLNPDNDAYATFAKDMLYVAVLNANGTVERYACDATNQFEVVVDDTQPVTGATLFRLVTGGGATTNLYLTTKAWTTYLDEDGRERLTVGYTTANTWHCERDEATGLLCRMAAAALNPGTLVDGVDTETPCYNRVVQGAGTATWYVVYPYGGANDFARGKTTTYLQVTGKPVIESGTRGIHWLHYQVFQAKGFDPRTGWMYPPEGSVDSSSYTHLDEFMSMVFFYRGGTITEADMQVTPQHSRVWIWQNYSTHPQQADTDGDQMPDGWEFYLMSRAGDAGPGSNYSPIFAFSRISPNDRTARDPDLDILQWPEEYSGVSSSGRYGWTPIQANWRNKSMPTDPWNEDTDGDGLKDGYEGGNGDNYYAGLVAAFCLYNTTGRAGGGLNPLSMDTDGDGLPDPWELEFHGSYSATSTATVNTAIPGSTNTTSLVVGNRCVWNMDGMDPTVIDARLDYDGDGLANWQEYMVGAMRCWRYDDCWNGWGVQTATFANLPDVGTDEWNQYWYDRLEDTMNDNGNYNPNLVNGYFDPAMYFTRCNNAWDGTGFNNYYYFKDGVGHNLDPMHPENPVTNVEIREREFVPGSGVAPNHYISCDPREIDSDGDGLDDYYELFHGMNPLLGEPGATKSTLTGPFNACDLVHDAYARPVNKTMGGASGAGPSALDNWWCNELSPHIPSEIKNPKLGGYDFVAYPWLNGIAGADPDGDNIVNQEEAIMPRVQAASTYHHTDPTPLWMTDTSYTNSLTRKYYRNAPPNGDENTAIMTFSEDEAVFEDPAGVVHSFTDYPGFSLEDGVVTFEYNNNPFAVASGWMWPFEENEGYDSDHDYLSDYEEGQGKTKRASDPQMHDSPLRRQAMYFNGTDAFLQTPVVEEEQTVGSRAYSEARQNFLYYTVECWAKADEASLRNDNGLRTLVERAIWADNASAADETLMRKNFLIGIKNGRWYTCFDSSGTDRQPVQVANGPLATTNWTHVAATYDGTALKLYVNGSCMNTQRTSVQPEHGVAALSVSKMGAMAANTTVFSSYCISILVGASAETQDSLVFDSAWRFKDYQYVDETTNPDGLYTNAPTIAKGDYGNFYKGYIDEVRIWDGARTAGDIKADYDNRTRYTSDLAATNRQEVFDSWCLGALRSPVSDIQLPPQLMYHWSFDHITGAVKPEDVAKVPAGFDTAKNVLNARAKWSRPADYAERCWQTTAVRSTVYTDCAWVPWINNTVSHLPRFDLATLDSVYWSEDYAGYNAAAKYGYGRFAFPRNAEVYSRYKQQTYGATEYYDSHRDPFFDYYNGLTLFYPYLPASVQDRDTRWHAIAGYDVAYTINEAVLKFRFASRDRNVSGDDLLPMGGAYPRRISAAEGGMWDDATASDAWAQTGNDADNNGLPDWWEEYARENYCELLDPKDPLEWDTTVLYYGVQMPAYEAYLRDLAKGLVKIGADIRYRGEYADNRDVDGDHIPDWWEDMCGDDTGSPDDAKADPDHDDLSSLIEYLISSMPDFPGLRADRMATGGADGQLVPDYFLRHGSLYLGEMFADHDMIEDWWEDAQPAELVRGDERLANYSRYVYDANRDSDNDGWSNWEECRASLHLGSREELSYVKTNVTVRTIVGSADDIDAAYAAAVNAYGEGNVQLTRSSASNEYASASLLIREAVDVFIDVPNYIGRPTPEVSFAVSYNGRDTRRSLEGKAIVVKAWSQNDVFDPDMCGEPDAAWVFAADDSRPLSMTTNFQTTATGYLRSGKNMFVAYVAEGAVATAKEEDTTDGETATSVEVPAYVPGQPYGVVMDVEVNYLRVAPFSIEMTDVNAAMVRVNLANALSAQASAASSFDGITDIEKAQSAYAVYCAHPTNKIDTLGAQYAAAISNCYNAVRACTDRGVHSSDYAQLACAESVGTNLTFESSNVLVRVFRSDINGKSYKQQNKTVYYYSSDVPVFETRVNFAENPYLTEGNMLAAGLLDLDWGVVGDVYRGSGELKSTLESATYRVVVGEGTSHIHTNNNLLAALVVNRYEPGSRPTVVSNMTVTAYGSQPTFFWTHANTIGKAYPAFRLVVKDGATVIYDSLARPAPARNAKGEYVFTAPIWPGMMTASGAVVEADRDYTWQVSMLDAKFSEMPADASSGTFRIRGSGMLNDYGTLDVAVKYMGPGKVATSGLKNLIRVEAYTSPDFSGAPDGVGYVSYVRDAGGVNVLAAEDCIETNATITGLLKGQDYYLKAFLDTDGDGVRADWESWGYMNHVGTETNELYAPRAVSLTEGARIPKCVIYMEDADTNNNQLPDVWEWNKDGCLGGPSTKGLTAKSPYVVTIDTTGAAAQSILYTVKKTGVAQLPYYAMLTTSSNGGDVPSASLALAMAGIDLAEVETSPEVTITSFSLTDGITFDVTPCATSENGVLVPKSVTIEVVLTLQLQKAETLGGGWTDVGEPVTKTFTISETTTVSDGELDAALRAVIEEQDGAGFFRVNVSSECRLVD